MSNFMEHCILLSLYILILLHVYPVRRLPTSIKNRRDKIFGK